MNIMYSLPTLVSGMSIGLVTILLIQLLIHHRHSHTALWLSAFCISVLAYLLRPYGPEGFTILNATGELLAPAVAVTILGVSKSLFEEKPTLSMAEWTTTFIYMSLGFSGYLNLYLEWMLIDDQATEYWLFKIIPQILQISLIVFAIYFTFKHIDTDLVEVRRQLRFIFIPATSVYLIAFLVSELVFAYQFPTWLVYTHQFLILMLWTAFHFWLFRFKPDGIFNLFDQTSTESEGVLATIEEPIKIADALKDPSPVDQKTLKCLETLMTQEKVYRQPGMTISSLAKLVDLQEYQLRRVINQNLGYRNFNTYLNQYRINEATTILSDMSKEPTSILTMAMDIGFNSLAPFNRAFKAATGLSPRDYRKSNMNRP